MESETTVAPELGADKSAPETVTTTAEPTVGFHELTGPERREFLDKGTLPTREKKADTAAASDGKTADSSTAPAEGKKAAESAASPSKPASEPGKPTTDKKARNSEENRVNELLEDRRRERERSDRLQRDYDSLKQRLDALERPKADGKTDSSTTAGPSGTAKEIKRPQLKDFDGEDGLERWEAAMADYVTQSIEAKLSERDATSRSEASMHQEMERVVSVAAERLSADEKAHPELIEKIDPGLKNLLPMRFLPQGEQAGPHHYAKDVMSFDCDHPLQLHAYYSTPDGQKEWASMMQMDRRGIERTIARRDLSFATASASGEAAKPAEAKAPAKTFTKTPPPPDKEGPKGAGVHDAAGAAVGAGDFAQFQREMDAREGVEGRRRYGIRRG